MKDEKLQQDGKLFGAHPLVALGIILGVVGLSFADVIEFSPSFASLAASPVFPFIESVHDLLALGVALFAAYKYSARLGIVAMALWLAAHTSYFILQFPDHAAELLRVLFIVLISILGISLIYRLRKVDEETRREADEWRTTFDSVDDLVSVQDVNFKIVKVNKTYAQFFKMEPEDLVGKACYQVVHGTNEPCPACPFGKALVTRKPATEEFFEPHLGAYVQIAASPIFGDGGDVKGCVHVVRDITLRKKAEETLRDSEERLKITIMNAPIGIATSGADRLILSANRAFCRIFGYTEAELQKMSFRDITHPDDIEASVAVMADLDAGTISSFTQEKRYIRKDGAVITGKVIVSAVRDKEGKPDLYIAEVEDITESKRAEGALRESEAKWRSLVENAPVGIVITSLDGRVIELNDAFLQMHNYESKEQFAKLSVAERYYDPKDRERWIELATKRGKVEGFEVQTRRKDGSLFWTSLTSTLRKAESGDQQFLTIVQDVTERREADRALQESERLYRSLFDNMLNGFAYCRMLFAQDRPADFIYLSVNSAFETLTGLQNVTGKRVSDVIPGIQESDPELFEIYSRVALTGIPHVFETYVKALDMWFSISVYSPQKEYFVAVFDVITNRKKAEDHLLKAEANFRNSLDESPFGIRIVTSEGELIYANKAILDIYGFSNVEELRNTQTKELYSLESYAEHLQRKELRRLGQPVPSNYGITIKRKDGEIRQLSVARKEVVWDGETQFQVLYQDITERRRADEILQQSEEKLRLMFESVAEGIAVVDLNGVIISVNQNMLDMHGFPSKDKMVGKPVVEFVSAYDQKRVQLNMQRTIEGGKIEKLEVTALRSDGSTFSVEVSAGVLKDSSGQPVGAIATLRDITERKKMQEQLIMQDRLASIGQLVSGVAHELNNPLTGVIGFSELLLQRQLPDDIKADLTIINDEAQRTARVVKNLLTFARKQPQEKLAIDVSEPLRSVLQMRAYEQSVNNIDVNSHFTPHLPQIMGNDSQLQQVFFNIVINAEQAMLDTHKEGTLTVTTQRTGDFVLTSIADDGSGISLENMKRLFTPFFTTKEPGKGTGLGLSICQAIVTEHGGRIWAESESGKGTTFFVELPVLQPAFPEPER